MATCEKTKKREAQNNMGNENTESNKCEEFNKEVAEQQMRMAIRDQITSQDVLNRNLVYICIYVCVHIYIYVYMCILGVSICSRCFVIMVHPVSDGQKVDVNYQMISIDSICQQHQTIILVILYLRHIAGCKRKKRNIYKAYRRKEDKERRSICV